MHGIDAESKRLRWALALTFLFSTLVVTPILAQEPSEPEQAEEEAAEPETAPAEPEELKGDVIYFKSGTVMDDVQVLQATIDKYIVQIAGGAVEPLELPREVVDRVEYDDIDPIREQRRRELYPDEKKDPIPTNISSELDERLRKPLGGPELDFEAMMLEDILTELGARSGVQLKVDKSVTRMPAQERQWTLTGPSEITLYEILQGRMLKKFEGKLELFFEYDTIIVLTPEALERRRNPDAAPPQPAQPPPNLPNFNFPVQPPQNP